MGGALQRLQPLTPRVDSGARQLLVKLLKEGLAPYVRDGLLSIIPSRARSAAALGGVHCGVVVFTVQSRSIGFKQLRPHTGARPTIVAVCCVACVACGRRRSKAAPIKGRADQSRADQRPRSRASNSAGNFCTPSSRLRKIPCD